ncbi:indoleamine 2,3-dioxygenase family protein [Polychaeton citri CBS 116435]|uniref:Indoleamine 2,3-dioxygenase n=1 Tax=Polychaeton citri CBS 116435 TaxID=1314669 RepID=A0A9P4PYG5_9PEZI|nr:indoleamine 2,3-dioxygenase family protein [Polychaeton citri CBS 116435]
MSPHSTRRAIGRIDLASYDVSQHAFLPSDEPLQQLTDPYYAPWELIVHNLPTLLDRGCLRDEVDTLSVLTTSFLRMESEWRRAYVVLAFLAQAYVWGGRVPSQTLPPTISKPFLRVSKQLNLPPVATYAALNLWNWRLTGAGADIGEPDNLRALHTFTGTVDEEWFYMISTAVEARAASTIPLMIGAAQAALDEKHLDVSRALDEFANILDSLTKLIERMHERCNPQVFYHRVRPYLAGSKNMENAGLPIGVFYDEGDDGGEWRKYRGGSNGQSSLVHFFDVVLGVEHRSSPAKGGTNFHEEMRSYMPGLHAAFLEELESMIDIRGFVDANSADGVLCSAFNNAVNSLSSFRDSHLQLVSRYIIIPSRSADTVTGQRLNIAVASGISTASDMEDLRGTGGTRLMPFLKQSRNETAAAAVTH